MYGDKKIFATLTNIINQISPVILQKLESLGKNYSKELLEKHNAVQGMLGDIPVLAFPMEENSWHCINYINYPKEPRFFGASQRKNSKVKLGLLGRNVFNISSEVVFLTEGIWDMLTLSQHNYPVLGLPGVNNFKDEWLEVFKDKVVYIIFDNDLYGKKYSEVHSKKLLTIAKIVKIINLPESIKYKKQSYKIKDASDLFNIESSIAKLFLDKLVEESPIIVADIKQIIEDITLSKGNSINKSMIITNMIIRDIEDSNGIILPFNNNQEMAIIIDGKSILIDEKVDVYLSTKYGFIPSDIMWRYIKDKLYVHALQKKEVDINLYSTFKNNKCYIGIRDEGLLIVDEKTTKIVLQGEDNIHVKSSNKISKEDLSFICSKEGISIDKFYSLNDILNLFKYDSEFNPEHQKFQLKVWFYYTFFNPIMKTALCIVGPPSCGKTLLQKILKGILFGFEGRIYNPNSMPEEDYVLTMMLKEYKYLFLDEVNENDSKIKSKLRMLVTGEETVFRPKYARRSIRFRPHIWLILSSHSPKFRDADISQRLCIIRLDKPEQKNMINESLFFSFMKEKRPLIWKSMIEELQKIIFNLRKHKKENIPLTNYCRQIEMANFAYQAFPEQRKLCIEAFNTMDQVQSEFSAEFDPMIDLIGMWHEEIAGSYSNNGKVIVSTKQLYNDLLPIAKDRGFRSFPVSIAGFGRWLQNRNKILKDSYGFERFRNTKENTWNYVFKLPEKESF